MYGVPQGSLFGPLQVNITDLCDLFFEDYSSDISNFADNITPNEWRPTLNEFMNNPEIITEKNAWIVQFQQLDSKCF